MRIGTVVLIAVPLLFIGGFLLLPALLIASLRGPDDKHLLGYSVETTATFDLDGKPAEARQVTLCEVAEVGGGFVDNGTDPRRVIARHVGGDGFHAILPDGSAVLLIRNTDLCRWTALPAEGTVETLYIHDGRSRLPAGVSEEQTLRGTLAWFDNTAAPKFIRLVDLPALTAPATSGIGNLRVTQRLTEAEPESTLDTDIPFLGEIKRDIAARGQPGWTKQANIDLQSEMQLILVSAVLGRPANSEACNAVLAPLADKPGWLLLDERSHCLGSDATPVGISIEGNAAHLQLDLDRPAAPSTLIAFSPAMLLASGATVISGTTQYGPIFRWTETICLEGQCFDVPAGAGHMLGAAFYHPASGRVVGVDFRQSDLPGFNYSN